MRFMLIALALPAAAVAETGAGRFEDLAALDARIAAVARVAPLDRRLRLLACPQLAAIDPSEAAVSVSCPALGWRLRLPVAERTAPGIPTSGPLARRGDPVQIVVSGSGFSAIGAGVALQDAPAGANLRVKTSTGAVISGLLGEDGVVRLRH